MSQASEKQIAFINKLMSEKDISSCHNNGFVRDMEKLMSTTPEKFTKNLASQMIDILLKSAPKAQASAAAATVEPGFYTYKNEVYKVQTSPNSGYNFAKVFTEEGGWLYAKGAVKLLVGAPKLTLETAKEYGKLYGMCIICSRTLTDEGSIEAGIGPVCAGKL